MINYEKGIITGKSGKVYKITPETISSARYTEYNIRGALLAYNTDFETIFTRIATAISHLRTGKENPVGNGMNAINELELILKGMVNYQENSRPAIIEFCSCFCIADGEDVSVHTEDQIRDKYEDWKHIPIYDFFLLATKATPKFKDFLIEILERNKQNNL